MFRIYKSEGYNLKRGSKGQQHVEEFLAQTKLFSLESSRDQDTSPVANETRLVLWPSCTYSVPKTLNMVLQQFRFYWIELLFEQDIILKI